MSGRARSLRDLGYRLRQEVLKQLGAAEFALDPVRTLSRMLEPRHRWDALPSAPSWSGLRGSLAAGSFPPDGESVIEEADQIADGSWVILGAPVTVDPSSIVWDAHPLSGHQAPRSHWSRCDLRAESLGGDVKYVWELNRHAQLVRLAQAWCLTERAPYLSVLQQLIDSWLAQHTPGVGINWASALEVGLRSLAWCWIRVLTAESPLWTADRERAFQRMLWNHGRFVELYDSRHHSPNTHLTGEALALLAIGAHFPNAPAAARWRRRGIALLQGGLEAQILTDGFHFERSVGYHRYSIEFALHGALLCPPDSPERRVLLHYLLRMSRALSALELSAGQWPALGDDDGGTAVRLDTRHPSDPQPVLDAASRLLNQSGAFSTDRRGTGLSWWLGLGSEPLAPCTAAPARLPDAGFVTARGLALDGSAVACLVSVGPHRGLQSGHVHSDVGHIELHWRGRPLIADPGSPAYSADPELRRTIRAETAHACLVLPDEPQAEPAGPFRWGTVGVRATHTVTEHRDGAWVVQLRRDLRGRAVHERTVVLTRGLGLLVLDRLLRASGRLFFISWPLIPDVAMGAGACVVSAGAAIRTVSSGSLEHSTCALAFARSFGERRMGTLLRYSAIARSDEHLVATMIVPAEATLGLTLDGGAVHVGPVAAPFLTLRPGVGGAAEIAASGAPLAGSTAQCAA